jgi:hypothetical protein
LEKLQINVHEKVRVWTIPGVNSTP